MQDRFVYTAHPSRVVFGAGSLAALADEVKALGYIHIATLAGALNQINCGSTTLVDWPMSTA